MCECGKVCIGPTGRPIEVGFEVHYRHLCLYELEKLAVPKYIKKSGKRIKSQETDFLAKISGCIDRLVNEAVEIIQYYIRKYQQIMEIHQLYYGTPIHVDQTKPKRTNTTEENTLKEIKKPNTGFSDMAIG